jgi:DNA repair exonuclease SbcCD nuclease subunit
VNQAELSGTQDFFGVSDVEVSLSTLVSGQPFPYFALGHVHKRQVLSTEPFVAYSGSLDRVDFGEGSRVDVRKDGRVETKDAEPKGFYRADLVRAVDAWVLADEPVFQTVAARTFTTIRTPDLDHADPMEDLSGRIARARGEVATSGAFVRVMATLDAADRGRITLPAVRDLVGDAYDVRLSLESPERAGVRDPRFAKRMSEVEALESYVSSRDDWGDDRDDILALGRALIAEAADR